MEADNGAEAKVAKAPVATEVLPTTALEKAAAISETDTKMSIQSNLTESEIIPPTSESSEMSGDYRFGGVDTIRKKELTTPRSHMTMQLIN